VFVLTKADLCPEAAAKALEAGEVAGGFPIILSSARDGAGAEKVRKMIEPELTAALIGSSGAGKSTLLNLLLGVDRQAVKEVRASDSRGRHTTTHREMFRIPGGGWLIDQPGLREIQITASEETVGDAFPEIVELAARCRFRDCRHAGEPGCAVMGQVDGARLKSFGKLRREAQRIDEEFDPVARTERKAKIKALHKAMRGHYRI
jgi:ribosome biogenesis GTPase